MIYAGWGLGEYFAGTVTMTPDYDDARDALARARVTVFVLDVTQADYHSLEVGLETIAEDTGGTYEKTFRQPLQMTKRLAHTLEGYYEIGFTGAGDRRRPRQGRRRAGRPPRQGPAAARSNQRLSSSRRRRPLLDGASAVTMPWSVRTSCSVSVARVKMLRMLRSIAGRFSGTSKKPLRSSSVSSRVISSDSTS